MSKYAGNLMQTLAERLKLEHQIYDADIHTASTRTTGTSESELVIRHLKDELSQSVRFFSPIEKGQSEVEFFISF
jgi:hypothetical protein